MLLPIERTDIGAITAVSGGNVGEGLASELEIGLGPIEFDAQNPRQAASFCVRVSQQDGAVLAEEVGGLDLARRDAGPLLGGEVEIRSPDIRRTEEIGALAHVG